MMDLFAQQSPGSLYPATPHNKMAGNKPDKGAEGILLSLSCWVACTSLPPLPMLLLALCWSDAVHAIPVGFSPETESFPNIVQRTS